MSFVVSGEGGGYQSTPLLILTVCIRNLKFSSAASTSLTITGPQRPTQSSPAPARYAPSSRKAPHPASSPISQSSCAPPDPYLIGFSCQPAWSYPIKPITSSVGTRRPLTKPASLCPSWFTLLPSANLVWSCVVGNIFLSQAASVRD